MADNQHLSNSMEVINEFISICNVCREKLKAFIIIENDKVVIRKECQNHGVQLFNISNNPEFYKDYLNFYHNILKKNSAKGKIGNYYLNINNVCNMNCHYCYSTIDNPKFEHINISELKEIFMTNKKVKITLSGGEPTIHPDFEAICKEIVKNKLPLQVASNGIKFSDESFCEKMALIGLKEVYLSSESFNEGFKFGNLEKFTKHKKKAISNLIKYDYDIILSPTIFKGINEDHIFECLDYYQKYKQIKEISINGFSWTGCGEAMDPGLTIMPDEISDIIASKYNYDRYGIHVLNKLFQAIFAVFNISFCLHNQIMVLSETNNGLLNLSDYFNINRLDIKLNRIKSIDRKRQFGNYIKLIYIVLSSVKLKIFTLLPTAFKIIFPVLFNTKRSRYSNQLLIIIIHTLCSKQFYDFGNINQCMCGMIYKKEDEICHGVAPDLVR